VPAPAFSLPNASGKHLSLEDTNGRVRIVTFWASWTPYSKKELLVLDELHAEYGDTVSIVAINRDKDPSEARRFVRELGIDGATWLVFDHDDTYYKTVVGYNMPETLLVDPAGNIVEHVRGPIAEEVLRTKLTTLLNE
jgi:thiol-disulfide isomerase/thioredoxin